MADTEIGAISIGISADTSQLKSALNQAKADFAEFKLPEREIPIRVRISTPTEAAIKKAQNQIDTALTKAQKLGVELSPTLTVKNVKIADFRNRVQEMMDGQKAINVDIKAEFDAEALHDNIQGAIGVIKVPLAWYWEDGPPPSGGTPGGAPSGPGPGKPGGSPAAGPTGAGAKSGAKTATPTKTAKTETAAVKACPQPGCTYKGTDVRGHFANTHASAAQKAAYEKHIKEEAAAPQATATEPQEPAAPVVATTGVKGKAKAPKVNAKATPAASAPVAPTAGAPVVATPGGAPTVNVPQVFTQTTARTPAQLREARFGRIVEQLVRGRAGGLQQLITAGGKINLDPTGGGAKLTAKRGSALAEYLKEAPKEANEALEAALGAYYKEIGKTDEGRQAFSHKARSLAGATPDIVTLPGGRQFLRNSPFMQEGIRQQIEAEAKERAKTFRNRDDVKALKASFQAEGFSALGPDLAKALKMVDTDPHKAREMTVDLLGKFFAAFPKEAKRLFAQDPGRPKGGGAGPGTKKPKQIKTSVGTASGPAEMGEVNPSLEATAAGMSAIFNRLAETALPRRRAQESEDRKEQIRARKSKRLVKTEAGLVPVEDEDFTAPVYGVAKETARHPIGSAEAQEALARAQQLKMEHAAAAAEAAVKEEARLAAQGASKIDPYRLSIIPPTTLAQQRYAAKSSPLPPRMNAEQEAKAAARAKEEAEADRIAASLRGAKPKAETVDIEARKEEERKRIAAAREVAARNEAKRAGRATGGPIKAGGLMGRLAKKGYELPEGAYIVGERGEEVFVPNQDGHIIDHAGQNIPEWLRRSKEGKGLAKDMTGHHRAGGGPVRFQAVPGSGRTGFRKAFSGEADAVSAGQLSNSGGVQRVFVTNWPAHGGAGFQQAPAGGAAGGPFAGGVPPGLAQMLGQLGNLAGGGGGGGKGGGKAKAPKAPKAAADTKLTPLEQAQVEATTQDLLLAEKLGLKSLSSQISAQLREAPTRGVQTATGEISSINLGGLRKVIENKRLADEAVSRAGTALGSLSKAENKLQALRVQAANAQDPKKIQQYTKAVGEQEQAVAFLRTRYNSFRKEADDLGDSVISGAGKLRVFTANTAGIVAGTFLFSGALTAAQTGLSALSQFFGPIAERMTGFTATTARVSAALDEQVNAQQGSTKTAVALTTAQAGLSSQASAAISPTLQQAAAIEEGNKKLQEGLDLVHTFEQTRRQGSEKGLVSTTNGFLGSIFGGTAATQEILKNELGGADVGLGGNSPENQARIADLKAKRAQLEGESNSSNRNFKTYQIAQIDAELGKITQTSNNLNIRLKFFDGALQKGGSSLHFLAGASEEVVKKVTAATDAAGLTELTSLAQGPTHVILVDENNQPVTGEAALKGGLRAIATSANTPDPADLIKQLTDRIIPAQRDLFAAQAQFNRDILNPAQTALANAASPTPGLSGGAEFGAGTVGIDNNTGKVDKAARAAADKYQKIVAPAIADVNSEIAKGQEALINLVPPNLRGEFSDLLGDITATGKQISGIQLGIQQKQTNLAVTQYNNELRIANRSLKDARDYQRGIAGATKDSLGGIQGENALLQRQLQLLGFQLAQRQINFQRAVAGFTAPGLTGEERAARIQEAKIEADFAQKQLDIQEKLASNDFKGIKITASRGVTDLIAQIGLLEQGKTLTIETAAASRALDVLNKKEQILLGRAGTYIDEGVQIVQSAMQAASEVRKQTGAAFKDVLKQTSAAWGIFGEQAALILAALQGSAPNNRPVSSRGDSESTNPGTHSLGGATGLLGDTMGPTQLTVGEVKGEKVAILKNPKLMSSSSLGRPSGGGTGGDVYQIIVSGNQFATKEDEATMLQKIVDAVERAQGRKSALLGIHG